jgi:hypothetical protein
MKTGLSLFMSFLVVLTNVLIGRFYAPNGILFTPIVLPLITLIVIVFGIYLSLIAKIGIVTVYTILHDIGIKLFSGGSHDNEGYGWIHAFLLFGLILSYAIILVAIFTHQNSTRREKLIAALLLPIGIVVHLYFCSDLGIGRCC